MKKRRIGIVLALILVCAAVWGVSIIQCEILTQKYAGEFQDCWEQAAALTEPEYCKVLKYNESSASVYYVSSDGKGGTVLMFKKQDSEWMLSEWGPYWSKLGSADDIIWPYIR